MRKPFDPTLLAGVSFFDNASQRWMRYLYPEVKHWAAGWIVVRNPSGEWMTLRKATDKDIAAINRAVVEAHHAQDVEDRKGGQHDARRD